jgi:outer membrane protein OmpA-like peptidoglycan-associated protein
MRLTRTYKIALAIAILFVLLACSSKPEPGPDKTIAGGLLGAGWGAGAGAIVGNQVATSGEGAAVGAGVGFINGLLSGAGYDHVENELIEQDKQLAALKISNQATAQELDKLQEKFDLAASTDVATVMYQTFFDPDATSLRSGAVANLEALADSIKRSPRVPKVKVVGHADDAGSPEYNSRLSESRARTVAAYLTSKGISSDTIEVTSFGSKRPLATNGTAEGRQLNRRVDIFIGR